MCSLGAANKVMAPDAMNLASARTTRDRSHLAKLTTETTRRCCSRGARLVAPDRSQNTLIRTGSQWANATRAKTKRPLWWFTVQGAERHARLLACAADAEYRDCSCRGAEREAQSLAHELKPVGRLRKLMPNPSLKRSANGMSRWPSSAGPAAHFALAVQRAMPLSPA